MKNTYFLNPDLMNSLWELKDKVLGCWCKDKGGGGKNRAMEIF